VAYLLTWPESCEVVFRRGDRCCGNVTGSGSELVSLPGMGANHRREGAMFTTVLVNNNALLNGGKVRDEPF